MPEQSPPCPAPKQSAEALRRHIDSRTGRRIRQFRVECSGSRVAVHGVASLYYLKQLALSAVREIIPSGPVELDIRVP